MYIRRRQVVRLIVVEVEREASEIDWWRIKSCVSEFEMNFNRSFSVPWLAPSHRHQAPWTNPMTIDVSLFLLLKFKFNNQPPDSTIMMTHWHNSHIVMSPPPPSSTWIHYVLKGSEGDVTGETGPNDAKRVVWAIREFSFCLLCFILLLTRRGP